MKEIELSKQGKKYKEMYKVIIDDDIFEEVNQYNWSYQSSGYANRSDSSTGEKKTILLHRYIWELKNDKIPKGYEVDHKDQNKLNCQISNLRLATRSQNNKNKSKRTNNTSGYIGVSKEVQKQKYKDKISIYEYWHCSWTDNSGKKRNKRFSDTNAGKIMCARFYDIMTSQSARDYTGELNFQSLEEYQKELSKAILRDIESNH